MRLKKSGIVIATLMSLSVSQAALSQEQDIGLGQEVNETANISDTFESTSKRLSSIKNDYYGRSNEYSLEDAVAFAIANNTTIKAAYKGVQSKQWNAISDKRLWWPIASGAGPYGDINIVPTWPTIGQRYESNYGKTYTEVIGREDGKPVLKRVKANSFTSIDSFVPAVHGRWTFFDMTRVPKINSSTEAAKAEELLFDMTVRDIVLNVQEGYYRLYSEIQYLESLERDYNVNVQQLNQARANYNSNPSLLNKNAIEQSKSTIYTQLEELINQHVKLITAATNMAKQMGLPYGTLVRPSADFKLRPVNEWTMDLMTTIDHALAHREEIQTAKVLAKSQNYLATSLTYSYLPKISLYGYAGYTNQSGPYMSSTTRHPDKSYRWGPQANIGVTFSWNFDGTVAAAKAKSLRYAAEQQMVQAEVAADMAEAQTADAYAEYSTSKMSLDTAAAALVNAKRARETTRQLYLNNQVDATAYTSSAQAVAVASKQYTQSIFKYNNSVAKLYRYTSIWPVGVSKALDEAVMVMQQE